MKFAGAQGITRSRVPLIAMLALAATIGLAGCEGDDGKDGVAGPTGPGSTVPGPTGPTGPAGVVDVVAAAKPESCSICHGDAGAEHQGVYDKYTDASKLAMTFTSVSSLAEGDADGGYTVTLKFNVTKSGAPYPGETNLTSMGTKSFTAAQFDGATGQFLTTASLGSSIVADGLGGFTLTAKNVKFAPEQSASAVFGYLAQGRLDIEDKQAAKRIGLYDDLASAALEFGAVETYASAANVSGCESCHGKPYAKHGVRVAQVANLPDFVACKVCHTDDRPGTHPDWQQLVDDPLAFGNDVTPDPVKYEYKASIMNDVHMSHVMEFPYPQSGANCVACHAGKLDQILSDENFTAATCKSCHAVDGTNTWAGQKYEWVVNPTNATSASLEAKRAPSLKEVWSKAGVGFHEIGFDCTDCHKVGGSGSTFAEYHSGYDELIYDKATGQKWAATNTVSVDKVTKTGNVLEIEFSATDPATTPLLAVSFYGWDSKDYIVSAHTRDANGVRMEKTIGTPNALFTEIPTGTPGTWKVSLDLAKYVQPLGQTATTTNTGLKSIPEMIAAGEIKKAEISVLPTLAGKAISATGKTFDVTADGVLAGDANYFQGTTAIASVEKCNACHGQLGTTFHSPAYGGSITVCRNCHVVTSGGSHLEMQSRSIDSYVHSIHAFQAFDPQNIDFADPVEKKLYGIHIEHLNPYFTNLACESCHVDATATSIKYGVPDQSKSMPGLFSASRTLTGIDREIGTVPAYVAGPASRACAGCHRAELINEDHAGELASLNAHTEQNGYLVDTSQPNSSPVAYVYRVIDKIMSLFE